MTVHIWLLFFHWPNLPTHTARHVYSHCVNKSGSSMNECVYIIHFGKMAHGNNCGYSISELTVDRAHRTQVVEPSTY